MKKFHLFLTCLIVSLVFLPCLALSEMKVSFLDAGNGAAVLVQADGQTALIDALGQTDVEALQNALASLGADKIDLLAETAPLADQSADAVAVLDKLRPSALWLPEAKAGEQAAGGIAEVTVPASGQSFVIGGAKITALTVSNSSGAKVPALALHIAYGQRAFLLLPLTADIDAGSILGDGEKRGADVLRAKGKAYLPPVEGVSPVWVISNEQPGQAEGLPEETQAPLMLTTALDGQITFITDGTAIREEHKAGGITRQGSVNVRREASTSAKRVTTLTKGSVVSITGSVAGKEEVWYLVDVDGKSGYIRSDLVQELPQEELDRLLAEATPKPQKSKGVAPQAGAGEEEPPAGCH